MFRTLVAITTFFAFAFSLFSPLVDAMNVLQACDSAKPTLVCDNDFSDETDQPQEETPEEESFGSKSNEYLLNHHDLKLALHTAGTTWDLHLSPEGIVIPVGFRPPEA